MTFSQSKGAEIELFSLTLEAATVQNNINNLADLHLSLLQKQ